MRRYCSLFDRNYLDKGLVMVESLAEVTGQDVQIDVLALDKETYRVLNEIRPPVVRAWPLWDLKTDLAFMANRTWQESCWTLASVWSDYLMHDEGAEALTYLDADLMFFADPEVIFKEIGDRSIGITPHRYAPKDVKRFAQNGHFNVQFVHARGLIGKACIRRWAEQCREWCFYRSEPGKFADQKYLDEFPARYPGQVCEIQNIGAGAAPWNIRQYSIHSDCGQVFLNYVPLLFYHFHELKMDADGRTKLTGWPLPNAAVDLIYAPYIAAIEDAGKRIAAA